MLGLDVRASILARFVSRKENYSPRLLRVAFKHRSPHAPRLVASLYQMLGPNCAHQPSRTCLVLTPAAHVPEQAFDPPLQPALNCASPGWKSSGGTDGDARSIQKCLRRCVRQDRRLARPREAAWVDSQGNVRSPLAVVHRQKVRPPAAWPGLPARLHPTSLSPLSVLAPTPAPESARAWPHFPPP